MASISGCMKVEGFSWATDMRVKTDMRNHLHRGTESGRVGTLPKGDFEACAGTTIRPDFPWNGVLVSTNCCTCIIEMLYPADHYQLLKKPRRSRLRSLDCGHLGRELKSPSRAIIREMEVIGDRFEKITEVDWLWLIYAPNVHAWYRVGR